MQTLGQRVLAGEKGLDRVVLWAHSCEMPDPWTWLGPDELLMTVGLCLPTGASDQVAFVQRLKAAQLAGMTIGDDQMAPPVTAAMLTEADRLDFPVLSTDHSVPFVVVGRTVALANEAGQAQQLLQISRLYRALNSMPSSPASAIAGMESTFGIRMAVVDSATRALLFAGSLNPTPEQIEALRPAAKASAPRPLGEASGDLRTWELSAARQALLVVEEHGTPMLDAFALAHLKQAVTAAVNNELSTFMLVVARGEHVVSQALSGQIPIAVLSERSRQLGLVEDEMVVLAVATDAPNDLLILLHAAGVDHLPHRMSDYVVCCINRGAVDAAVAAATPLGASTGISRPFATMSQIDEAIHQAVWALTAAPRTPGSHTKYEQVRGSVLPRDSDSATEIVNAVLGTLTEEGNNTLLHTLATYLANDRSWQTTADELSIHRQTLGYRLRQIEAATGRNLKSSRDIAELWVAVASHDVFRTRRRA